MRTKYQLSSSMALMSCLFFASPSNAARNTSTAHDAGSPDSMSRDTKKNENENPIDGVPRFRIGFEKTAIELAASRSKDSDGFTSTGWSSGLSLMPDHAYYPLLALGYRLSDNLFVGGKVSVQLWQSKSKDEFYVEDTRETFTSKYKWLNMSLSPHVSYWFGKDAVRPFVTVEGHFGYGARKSEDDRSGDWSSSAYTMGAGLGGGVHIFVGEHISLDASILGQYVHTKYKENQKYRSFEGDAETSSGKTNTHTFHLVGNLGISGWL